MNSSLEQEFGYSYLLRILLRRAGWFLGLLSLSLIAALAYTATRQPSFRSAMQLIIEPNFEEDYDPAEAEDQPSERQRQTDYATQLNLMRSNELLERAVGVLEAEYPELTIRKIQRSLSISQIEEGGTDTRIVSVAYNDIDPVRTQRVLETLQSVYLAYALERQEQRLSRGLSSINQQFEEASRSLSESQSQLKTFRESQNVIDPQRQAAAVTDSLNQVIAERQALQAQYESLFAESVALQRQVDLSGENAYALARLSQSPRFQSLLNTLQEVELALAERLVTYAEADIGVQSLLQQRENQLLLLRQEAERVLGVGLSADVGAEQLQTFGQLSEIDVGLVQSLAQIESQLEGIAARSDSLVETEQDLRSQLNQFPALIDSYNRLQPQIETQQELLEQLLTQRELLGQQLARGGFSWQMVAMPQPGIQTGPNHRKNMLLGAVVGLFLGGTAAFIREALDDMIRTPEDLQRVVPVPVLGVISEGITRGGVSHEPGYRLPKFLLGDTDEAWSRFWHTLRDSFDLVYRRVRLYSSRSGKLVSVTSTLTSEESSTVAVGIALSAARMGQRVILLDANLRHSMLQERFDLPSRGGLADLLDTSASLPTPVTVDILNTRFDVISGQSNSVDAIRVLSSPLFRRLIKVLESRYDLVVIDTPPILGTADVLEIASICQDLLVVTQLGQTTKSEMISAIAAVAQESKMVGVVAYDAPLFDAERLPVVVNSEEGRPILSTLSARR